MAGSEYLQNGPQDPAEAVAFSYNNGRAPYSVMIRLYSGPTTGLDLTVFSFYNDLEYASAASSLMDPAPAHGAYTVGAVHRTAWPLSSPPVESYSSRGPTNDGRLKPDIVAPDGTTSMTYGFGGAFGTSFSAPTVAGAAALLVETASGQSDERDARAAGHLGQVRVAEELVGGQTEHDVADGLTAALVSALGRSFHARATESASHYGNAQSGQ